MSDDLCLLLSGAFYAVHGAWALAHPSSFEDAAWTNKEGRNRGAVRWLGLGMLGYGGALGAAAGGPRTDQKRAVLVAVGAMGVASAVRSTLTGLSGHERADQAIYSGVLAGGLGAWALREGLRKQ